MEAHDQVSDPAVLAEKFQTSVGSIELQGAFYTLDESIKFFADIELFFQVDKDNPTFCYWKQYIDMI